MDDQEKNNRAAYVHPAVFANRFSVSVTGPFLRIGVSEQNPFQQDQLEPRGAIMMATSDAAEMARIILELIEKTNQTQPEAAASGSE